LFPDVCVKHSIASRTQPAVQRGGSLSALFGLGRKQEKKEDKDKEAAAKDAASPALSTGSPAQPTAQGPKKEAQKVGSALRVCALAPVCGQWYACIRLWRLCILGGLLCCCIM
jgi:hypothetical protein